MPYCPPQISSIWSWYTRPRASSTAGSISRTSCIFHPLTAYSYLREEKVTWGMVRGCRSDGGTLPFCCHLEVADQTKPCVLACCLDTDSRCLNIFSWHPLSNAWGTLCVSADPQFGLEEQTPYEDSLTFKERNQHTLKIWPDLPCLVLDKVMIGYLTSCFLSCAFKALTSHAVFSVGDLVRISNKHA
jgi:hypothetical protein